MKSTLKVVAHPETGATWTESSNPGKAAKGWGKMRIDSICAVVKNGLVILQKRTAFVSIQKAAFDFMGYTAGQTVKGAVIRRLAFTPFYEGQNPVTIQETGEVVLLNGAEYFQDYKYTDNENAQLDQWILPEVPAEEIPAAANVLNTAK